MGLEGYAIGEIIAESAYSVVRRATRRVDGERVILKLNAREVPSAREIGQLEFEHRILRKLSNPAVIRALALESQGDRLALVLEDYGGVDLSERLGVQRAHAGGALRMVDHQPRTAQQPQVLGDRRPTHSEIAGDLADRSPPLAQQRQDLPSCRISQRFENFIHTYIMQLFSCMSR